MLSINMLAQINVFVVAALCKSKPISPFSYFPAYLLSS